MPGKGKPLSYTNTVPPAPSKGKGLRITWSEPLGDIRLIDIERRAQYVDFRRKCSNLKAESAWLTSRLTVSQRRRLPVVSPSRCPTLPKGS